MARPLSGESGFIEIDFNQLEKLCSIQCTKREVCSFFKCSPETIERRIRENYDLSWTDYYEKHKADGLVSLRRKQLEVALTGNPTLLIWLGKQYLEQSDKQENKSTTDVKISIEPDDQNL